MKILHIIPSLGIGGTEKILYQICGSRLLKRHGSGFTHEVISLKGGGLTEKRLKELKDTKVELLNSGDHFLNGLVHLRNTVKCVRERIKTTKPDILHTWLTRANAIGGYAAKGLGIRVISSLRVMEQEKWYHIFAERFTSKYSHITTVNSEALKEFAIRKIGIPKEKIICIPNGISIEEVAESARTHSKQKFSSSKDGLSIGIVSRLHRQKGVDLFIKAAGIVLKKHPHVQFFIAGDGPERNNLEQLTRQLGIGKSVVFCGWIQESLEFVSNLDIFVLASRWEGCPNVILEAMSQKKPIVATGIPGIRELIEDRKEGILIPPENPQACANAIEELIQNPHLRSSLAHNAREKVESQFSLNSMIHGYINLYEKDIWNH